MRPKHVDSSIKASYVNNTKNNGHLHFVRIGEDETILRSMPGGVEAKCIGMTIWNSRHGNVAMLFGPVPSRMPNVEGLGEYVVVDQPGIHGERAHEQDYVATAAVDGQNTIIARTGSSITY